MDRENHDPQILPSTPAALTTIVDKKSNEEYKVLKQIGEGGFAKCYQVVCSKGKHFAAKVVKKSDLTKSKTKEKVNCVVYEALVRN